MGQGRYRASHGRLIADDPRRRLLGALAMATVRVALDDWLAHGGPLPERVHRGLTSIRVD